MCLGNQEIPHYCSLDILRSFTSTGHETGPRIIHKSVFKAKYVRRDIDENVPKLTCHSGRDCTAALNDTQENLYCMCMFTSVYSTVSLLDPWTTLPNGTGRGQCCAWEYWEVNLANKLKTSEHMLFVLRAP